MSFAGEHGIVARAARQVVPMSLGRLLPARSTRALLSGVWVSGSGAP